MKPDEHTPGPEEATANGDRSTDSDRTPPARGPSPLARDFDELERGQRFATRGRTITETDVVWFAALTGDWHPQHADAAWAAESRFGERVAHGMLLLSYAAGLVELDPQRVVALRRVRDAVFNRPARLGDTICVEGRVEHLEPLDDELGLVTFAWRVLNQNEETVARARIDVLWRRGDGADEPVPRVDGRERTSGDANAAALDAQEPGSTEGVVVPL
jgi:3-hydroxybutyryl-CoA dehydratase